MEREQKKGRAIELDVMYTVTDQRDFASFYSFEKNPRQKALFMTVLVIGLLVILLRDRGLPPWIGFIGLVVMVVLLFLIWRQRSRAARAAQGAWFVQNRLRAITLDEEGIAEWDMEARDEDDDEGEQDDQGDDVAAESFGDGVGAAEAAGRVLRSGRWEDLPDAYESARYFYVFLKEAEAFVLQKTRMTENCVGEVRALLTDRMGQRFISRK